MNLTLTESRKLNGLLYGLGALLLLVVIAVLAMWLLGIDWQFFGAIGTQIAGMTGMHQGSQMMADRSPNYPNAPLQAPPSPGSVEGMR